jgi:hypothetical protein
MKTFFGSSVLQFIGSCRSAYVVVLGIVNPRAEELKNRRTEEQRS